MDGSRMSCKFCGHEFAKDTSISRIKLHLAGVKGRGVRICGQVPQDVQDAALAAIDGPPEKKLKIVAGTSNNEVTNAAQQQNNEMMASITVEDQELQVIGSFHERPSFNQADEPRGDPSQPTNDQLCCPSVNNDVIMNDSQNLVGVRIEPVVQVLEQSNVKLDNLSVDAGRTQVEEEEEEDVVNHSGRLEQPDAGGSYSGGPKHNPSESRGAPLLTGSTKLVGRAFEENRKVIWSLLMDDEVSIIGIYGMGGAGKTTMLKHVYNELLQSPDISHHVYWVTLSRDSSIHKMQKQIAKCIKLSLSNEEELGHRAAELSQELMKKQRWILILDDLWNSFELHKVGIPVPLKGCKLLITTRSEAVCRRMNSTNIVRVVPLSTNESWDLFIDQLGHDIALSPQVEQVARDITRDCAGLPLGIITLARSLRGVDDQDEWRKTLEKLKELKSRDKVDDAFWMLRFSYDRLDDFALQQSLLYCALFPEGHEIEREELIGYLIHEGIIEKMGRREAAFHKGHAMLDRLENAGLLQRIDGGRAVKMHDLVRDMANLTRKENPSAMEQRRKGIEMAGSNIDPFWNHVEQMNDGGNSTHKTMGQERKRIEMTPLKSGWTGAITAYAREQNNVDMAQQREPLFTGEFERANDLTGAGIELPHDTPDNQDELKKLKGSKSRDMVDDFKSKLIGAVSASAREQNNVEMAQQQESLLTGEFERANDLTAAGIERPRDTPDDQDDFKSRWTLLMTNLILEMASAVFDQLGYALVGMVLAFVALLLSTAELIYMEIMARRESRSLLPWKPVGTIVEYFGLVGAVWQCFYSTVEYAYARQKKDNPINMCLLPFIFLLCVVISNFY